MVQVISNSRIKFRPQEEEEEVVVFGRLVHLEEFMRYRDRSPDHTSAREMTILLRTFLQGDLLTTDFMIGFITAVNSKYYELAIFLCCTFKIWSR